MPDFDRMMYRRFVNLIGESYKNPELHELLKRAKPGEIIKYEDIKNAGADVRSFRRLDRYFVEDKGGFTFTDIGKTTFETQLIADKKDVSKKKTPSRIEPVIETPEEDA